MPGYQIVVRVRLHVEGYFFTMVIQLYGISGDRLHSDALGTIKCVVLLWLDGIVTNNAIFIEAILSVFYIRYLRS